MAIKDILVHVVDGDAGAARVRAAAALARTHQAHLTGLYTMWIPPIPGYIEAQIGAEVMQTQRSLYLEQARLAEETFNECAEDASCATGTSSAQWSGAGRRASSPSGTSAARRGRRRARGPHVGEAGAGDAGHARSAGAGRAHDGGMGRVARIDACGGRCAAAAHRREAGERGLHRPARPPTGTQVVRKAFPLS